MVYEVGVREKVGILRRDGQCRVGMEKAMMVRYEMLYRMVDRCMLHVPTD